MDEVLSCKTKLLYINATKQKCLLTKLRVGGLHVSCSTFVYCDFVDGINSLVLNSRLEYRY